MSKEIWKRIDDFENYEVSNFGRIRPVRNIDLILKPSLNGSGYSQVFLRNNKGKSNRRIHREVAMAFIPNPENKPCVNHKDGDKLNNHANNLEWCTHSENTKHAIKMGLMVITDAHKLRLKELPKNCNRKKILDTETDIEYDSLSKAAKSIGMEYNKFVRALNQKHSRFKRV